MEIEKDFPFPSSPTSNRLDNEKFLRSEEFIGNIFSSFRMMQIVLQLERNEWMEEREKCSTESELIDSISRCNHAR